MGGLSHAWDRFFCMCCQLERPNSEKVKVSPQHVRCTSCINKGKRRVGNPKMVSQYIPEDVDTSIPAEILDRYTESAEET